MGGVGDNEESTTPGSSIASTPQTGSDTPTSTGSSSPARESVPLLRAPPGGRCEQAGGGDTAAWARGGATAMKISPPGGDGVASTSRAASSGETRMRSYFEVYSALRKKLIARRKITHFSRLFLNLQASLNQ